MPNGIYTILDDIAVNYNTTFPSWFPIATSGNYDDLIDRPNLATVATNDSYVETEESNEDALDIFIGTGFNNIVRYARDHKFEFEEFKDEYERLRALWTSYCIINNFTCEHRKYIPSLKHIYLIIGQNNNMSYDDFVVYMGALFNWRLR